MKTQSLKISLVLALSFYGLGSCTTVVENPAALDSPNVIIMLADDLGWADVGYRGSDIKTPNLDQLAADGLRLERFYTKTHSNSVWLMLACSHGKRAASR